MLNFDTSSAIDDAADTLRFCPAFDSELPTDPDMTSIYDLGSSRERTKAHYVGRTTLRRMRLIRATRFDIDGLRAAIAAGWDVGPELAHEQRRLAALEAVDRRP